MIGRGCTKMKISTLNYFIVDALKSINENSSYEYRSKIASLNNVKNYTIIYIWKKSCKNT